MSITIKIKNQNRNINSINPKDFTVIDNSSAHKIKRLFTTTSTTIDHLQKHKPFAEVHSVSGNFRVKAQISITPTQIKILDDNIFTGSADYFIVIIYEEGF